MNVVFQSRFPRAGWERVLGLALALLLCTLESVAAPNADRIFRNSFDKGKPDVDIRAPSDGSAFVAGDVVAFEVRAFDAADKLISDQVTWVSDRAGELATGAAFELTTLGVGEHLITASVTNSSGLEGSDQVTITITAGNAAPVVDIDSPTSGSIHPSGAAIAFAGGAMDPEDGDLGGDLAWSSDRDGPFGTGPSVMATLSSGAHSITATVSDSGGLTVFASINLVVEPPQNASPSVTVTAPASGTALEQGQPVTFVANAQDPEDGDLSVLLNWSSDRDGALGAGASVSIDSLSAGPHVVTAQVVDSGGLGASDQVQVTVNAANSPPSLTLLEPQPGSSAVVGNPVDLSASASDPEDGDLGALIEWRSDQDGALGTGATVVASGLSLGLHTITATVHDGDGLAASAQVLLSIVDDQPPAIDITAPADGDGYFQDVTINFAADATDAEDGDLGASVTWTSSLDGPLGTGPVLGHAGLSLGTHVITASVSDSAGASRSDSISVTIEAEPADGVLVRSIGAGIDDAEENPDGGINLSSSDLELGLLSGTSENQVVGLRFDDIAIEPMSTIVSAHLQFAVDETDTGATELRIQGEASDHALPFDATNFNLSGRTRTDNQVFWSPEAWPQLDDNGPAQESPDLAEIINEITDRPNWASGNALVLLISGEGRRVAQSYDKSAASAATLHIAYRLPGGNRRPVVDAGADQVLLAPEATLQLAGQVSDDLLPESQPLVTLWSHVGGTGLGNPVFDDPFAIDTTVTIGPDVGSYILRLTADDGEFSSSDEMEIRVTANNAATSAGTVNISMKVYRSTNDRLFDEDPDPLTQAQKDEMAGMYSRLLVSSPSFDEHLSWFSGAMEYQDLYKIDTDAGPGDPEWEFVLRDAEGNPLYIDFACDSSPPCSCPQYAGDYGDPGFRQFWIDRQRPVMDRGYTSLFVDDIPLHEIKTSDACGNPVTPMDPRTGQPMTTADMQKYMAEFAEAIRQGFPDIEIVHNAIFAAQPADNPGPGEPTFIERQLMAADVINFETGAPVKEGGFHNWGFESWLAFVDTWHARGKHFIVNDDDSVEDDDGEVPYINADELRELRYQLAAFYLINDGGDFLSADGDAQKHRVYPSFWAADAFSTDYQQDLGDAVTGHYRWNGLFRRDFQCGIVLVNQPEQPTIEVALDQTYIDLDGNPVGSVNLPAVSGAVLTRPCDP